MTIMLSDLLDQVRAAGGADRRLDALIAVAIDGFVRNGTGSYCAVAQDGSVRIPAGAADSLVPAYTGSLDAAIALIERRLPTYQWSLSSRDPEGWYSAHVRAAPLTEILEDGATAELTVVAAMIRTLVWRASQASAERKPPNHKGGAAR